MSLLWYEMDQRDRCLENLFADPFSVHSLTVTVVTIILILIIKPGSADLLTATEMSSVINFHFIGLQYNT